MTALYIHIAPNEKVYIGITGCKNPEQRWGKNGEGYKHNQYFWRAIQKYDWNNFQHIILADNLSKEWACQLERDLIWKYRTQNPDYGYNLSVGGDTNAGYHHTEVYKENLRQRMLGKYVGEKSPCFGINKSQEIKERISKSLSGRKQSEKTRQKRSQSLIGHVVTDETRQKISAQNKGRILSDETRQRMSESQKGRKKNAPGYWKGKTRSEETRQRMSESHKNVHKTEEHKQKLSASLTGIKRGPMSEEHKQKIRDAHLRRRSVVK